MSNPPVSLFIDVEKLPWVERRPGIFWKVLWEDPDGKRKAILMRYAPGATIPRHRHVGDEQIYVLEGTVADDTGVCTAGNYARRPPGCVHSVRSETGALVFAVTSGPTEPV
ncbi:MAG TPA: cupin domain-containing protein [Methylomirabilota bacterium]|nr:cupin domain-containing protein [Methylomirabilota bacterium]